MEEVLAVCCVHGGSSGIQASLVRMAHFRNLKRFMNVIHVRKTIHCPCDVVGEEQMIVCCTLLWFGVSIYILALFIQPLKHECKALGSESSRYCVAS